MSAEEWRPIFGHPNYEVSDLGRVRSLDRVLIRDTPIGPLTRRHRGKVLVPLPKEAGHLWVWLGRGNPFYVHHLVLQAFVGPAPCGTQCCHWDDDPSNNRLDNLRWDTRAANVADFRRNHGRSQGIEFPHQRRS